MRLTPIHRRSATAAIAWPDPAFRPQVRPPPSLAMPPVSTRVHGEPRSPGFCVDDVPDGAWALHHWSHPRAVVLFGEPGRCDV